MAKRFTHIDVNIKPLSKPNWLSHLPEIEQVWRCIYSACVILFGHKC